MHVGSSLDHGVGLCIHGYLPWFNCIIANFVIILLFAISCIASYYVVRFFSSYN